LFFASAAFNLLNIYTSSVYSPSKGVLRTVSKISPLSVKVQIAPLLYFAKLSKIPDNGLVIDLTKYQLSA